MLISLLAPKLHANWARPYPIDSADNRKHHSHQSKPYLTVINPPALRFETAKSPSELLNRPPIATGPPRPEHTDDIESADPLPLPAADPELDEVMEASAEITGSDAVPEMTTEPQTNQNPSTPPPIIPDDAPERTRHEDFLPFFRFPGPTGEDVTVGVPMPDKPAPPPRLPPSSATYQQR